MDGMMKKLVKGFPAISVGIFYLAISIFAQTKTLDQLQREHVELRFGLFMHFNMNTYSPGWGNPRVNPLLFNPTSLDCSQWAKTAKAAGMTYALLTAKHHDGFVLWPSQQTPPNGQVRYTVAQSSVPTKDIVSEYVTAFRAQGLQPGLYFSMWDVANGVTGWSTAERTFVLGQLTELLGGKYGQIPILVIDGWAWKMGHKTIPYQQIRDTVKSMQPNCLIVDHNGLMSPWEEDIFYVEEPKGLYCPAGNTAAACQGTTISGGWFWDASAASAGSLMSLDNVISHLNTLEPRYCNFLLNCPPNRSGVLDAAIVTRLTEVGAKWKPNASRAPLPTQMANIEHPITPVSATASSGTASNAIDGISDAGNVTPWTSSVNGYVTLDLGSTIQNIGILGYLPSSLNANAVITGYTVSVSTNNTTFTQVASGTWPSNVNYRTVAFTPTDARYVRLTGTAAASGSTIVASEVDVGVRTPVQNAPTLPHPRTSARHAEVAYRVTGGYFVFPVEFSHIVTDVSVYSLAGKLLRKATVSNGIFNFGKEYSGFDGVCLVKLTGLEPVR
jgi:alpha-L-fucosidase